MIRPISFRGNAEVQAPQEQTPVVTNPQDAPLANLEPSQDTFVPSAPPVDEVPLADPNDRFEKAQ